MRMNIKNTIRNSLVTNSIKLVIHSKNSFSLSIVFTVAVVAIIFFFNLFNVILIPWVSVPFIALAVFLLIYYYKIGMMALFDFLFVISFLTLKRLFDFLAGEFPLPTTSGALYIFIIFSLVYYLVVLFAYSFFKYGILHFIRSLYAKSYFSTARLWDFYLLNLIIAGIFLAIILVFNLLLASIKQNYAPYLFIMVAIPYILFLYVVVNISHSIFYRGDSISDSLKNSLGLTFTRMKTYRETIMLAIVSVIVLWLVFLGTGYLVRYFTAGDNIAYLAAYGHFRQISLIVIDAAAYILIFINRISFYAAVNQNKSNRK